VKGQAASGGGRRDRWNDRRHALRRPPFGAQLLALGWRW